MRLQRWLMTIGLALAIPAMASAQSTSGTTGTTGTAGTTTGSGMGTTTDDPGSAQTTTPTGSTWLEPTDNHWFVSGFLGSNFGRAALNSSVDFGGAVGYMWNSAIGGEFLAGFSPSFQMTNAFVPGENPQVNSFMVNAIAAIPIGIESQWQPFVSAGLGAVTLRSDVLNNNSGNAFSNTFSPDASRIGGDIGGGVMGFVGNFGIRADVRYFRAFTNNDLGAINAANSGSTAANAAASTLLSGLDFWRANVGVAFRW